MISCKEVTEKSSDYVDGRLSLRTRLGIWMHILICVHCRRYVQQIRSTAAAITQLGRKSSDSVSDDKVADLVSTLTSVQKTDSTDH